MRPLIHHLFLWLTRERSIFHSTHPRFRGGKFPPSSLIRTVGSVYSLCSLWPLSSKDELLSHGYVRSRTRALQMQSIQCSLTAVPQSLGTVHFLLTTTESFHFPIDPPSCSMLFHPSRLLLQTMFSQSPLFLSAWGRKPTFPTIHVQLSRWVGECFGIQNGW